MNEDICKKILITFECLLAAHPNIKFRFEKQTYRNVVSSMPFHPESNAINTIKALNQFDIKYQFDFGIFNDEKLIDEIGTPFNFSISKIIGDYINDKLDDEHINIWTNSIERRLPLLVDTINKYIATYTGTDKWLYFLNKRVDSISNIINEHANKRFSINSVKIEQGNFNDPRYTIFIVFNKFLNYYLKSSLEKAIFNKLKPIYEIALDTDIRNARILYCLSAMTYYYMSENKTSPTDTLIFKFPTNSWKSIAISEDAQYLPKLGHKKNGC